MTEFRCDGCGRKLEVARDAFVKVTRVHSVQKFHVCIPCVEKVERMMEHKKNGD